MAATQLKVGDRVVVAKDNANDARVKKGDTGVVVGVRTRRKPKKPGQPAGVTYFDVKVDQYRGDDRETGTEADWGFTADNLKAVQGSDEKSE